MPQPSVPKDLAVGEWVKASGLTLVVGKKNGRPWQIFRASALMAVKPG